jgi:putative phosphoribosyl transferase
LRRRSPGRIVVAVPVAPRDSLAELRPAVEDVVCWTTPEPFHAVGAAYEDFSQVGDDAVRDLLERAHARMPAA